MRIDAQLAFVPVGSNLSLVAAAGVAVPSTNVIDLLGQGVGTAPANIIGSTLFGADFGVGMEKIEIQAVIGTAATTGTSATLNMAFQAAPDTGVGGGYLPGTYQTLVETGALTAAQLTAGALLRLDWPVVFPATLRPRFVRLLFSVPAATDFTAGTISYAIVVPTRDDVSFKQAAKNYAVA